MKKKIIYCLFFNKDNVDLVILLNKANRSIHPSAVCSRAIRVFLM